MSTPESEPQSSELIAFKIGELTKSVEKGFGALDTRMNDSDKRILAIEIWKAGVEASTKVEEKSGMSMTQIIVIILGILGAAVGALSQVIHK